MIPYLHERSYGEINIVAKQRINSGVVTLTFMCKCVAFCVVIQSVNNKNE